MSFFDNFRIWSRICHAKFGAILPNFRSWPLKISKIGKPIELWSTIQKVWHVSFDYFGRSYFGPCGADFYTYGMWCHIADVITRVKYFVNDFGQVVILLILLWVPQIGVFHWLWFTLLLQCTTNVLHCERSIERIPRILHRSPVKATRWIGTLWEIKKGTYILHRRLHHINDGANAPRKSKGGPLSGT